MSISDNVALVKTKFIGDEAVVAAADWASVIGALRAAYAAEVTDEMVPNRSVARGKGFWLRGLSAVSPSGKYMGCKLIAASPKEKRASYLIPLYDQKTMDLAALIDGNRITGYRTAGTAVVAIELLAQDAPLTVAIIGSGYESRGLFEALLSMRQIAEARVFSPTPANRERYATDFAASHGVTMMAAASAEEAVTGANLILCAARSHDESPTLKGAWLSLGALVVSLGSTLQEQREVDEETLDRAAMIVADMPEEVLHETGDAIAAAKAGVALEAKTVSLGDLASGKVARPTDPNAIIIYKSVGSALQDIVIAEMILERATAAGQFFEMPESIHTIVK